MTPVPTNRTPGWEAQVALAINMIANGYPYLSLDSEPPDPPHDGYTYFDTALGKVRTFASGVWNDHY